MMLFLQNVRLMKLRTAKIALLSICCAVAPLFIGACTKQVESPDQSSEPEEKVEMTRVVYAAKNIEEGEIIAQETLEERDVATSNAPVDAFNSTNAVVGQIAAYPIPAGTIVSNHAIKPMEVQSNFESKIPKGMRAITFGVDTYSNVGGFVEPGSHVDILGISGQSSKVQVSTILANVEVIAVGGTYVKAPGSTTANPADYVTVAVDSKDASKLVKALAEVRPYLALASKKDKQ